MPKPFITYDQQVALLKSKHLIITDEDAAKRALAQIGYFSLIGGYKHPFKNKTTKMYRDGVTFEDIIMLYHYDEALRRMFLRYLLMIERSIKARVAYVFCDAHGDSQAEYLNPRNYISTPAKQAGVNRLISTLSQLAIRPTDYPYINHHQNVHHNAPLWVLINAVTFGSVSKMFVFLTQNLQSRICREYPLNIRQMDQILSVLTKYRNAFAHGERLFSYTTRDDIPDLPIHAKLGITKRGNQYVYGKHDLFAVVIAFRYLLPSDAFLAFKQELSKEIDRFSKNCSSLSQSDLLSAMGFPSNWKNISRRYKLQL